MSTIVITIDELQDWLSINQIDATEWGHGGTKAITNLRDELAAGECVLHSDPPLRSVKIVQIIIRKGSERLTEIAQEMGDGRQRQRNQPPSEKVKSGENFQDAALRCLREELGIEAGVVTFLPNSYEEVEKVAESKSYPGLMTQYTFYVIDALVSGLPEVDFWRENLAFSTGDPVWRHLWGWREEG